MKYFLRRVFCTLGFLSVMLSLLFCAGLRRFPWYLMLPAVAASVLATYMLEEQGTHIE